MAKMVIINNLNCHLAKIPILWRNSGEQRFAGDSKLEYGTTPTNIFAQTEKHLVGQIKGEIEPKLVTL